MALVGLAFLLGALAALGFAFGVRGVGEFVFERATEFLDAFGWLLGGAFAVDARGVMAAAVVMETAFFVAAFGEDVGFAGVPVQALHARSFVRIEAGEVLLIVVGVLPY